jgi:putative tryptophan/tyrosine transport system substrate-binding protein
MNDGDEKHRSPNRKMPEPLTFRGTTRRNFLSFVLVLATPLVALAQVATKVHRIGVLGNNEGTMWDGLRKGLRELGYVEGQNITIVYRWSDGFTERLPSLAIDLVRQRMDLIVASGTQATRAAMQATTSTPIVMATGVYPDKLGLVASLARPGGNVTGLSNVGPELNAKKIEFLKELAPRVSRLAVIHNPSSPVEAFVLPELKAVAQAAGVEVLPVEVRTPDELPAALSALLDRVPDALYALGNPANFKSRQLIADFALERRLPSVFQERMFVKAGGLLSYAPSFIEMFRRAATYVDKILNGAKPADLPVEQPTQYELAINRRTAQALGLTIPPSLLLRADHIIA